MAHRDFRDNKKNVICLKMIINKIRKGIYVRYKTIILPLHREYFNYKT